jgi:hypothetical protein
LHQTEEAKAAGGGRENAQRDREEKHLREEERERF